jgi:hypothetical protein
MKVSLSEKKRKNVLHDISGFCCAPSVTENESALENGVGKLEKRNSTEDLSVLMYDLMERT